MANRTVFTIGVVTALFGTAACGGDDGSADTLAPLPTTATTIATTVAPSTLIPLPTTLAPGTSTTTSIVIETTTTVPPAEQLVMRGDGLGDVLLGVNGAAAVDYITKLIGSPTDDTGEIAPEGDYVKCNGTKVRVVTWGDLKVYTGDESPYGSGRMHFYGWQYGPVQGSLPDPLGPTTDGDITLGSTVNEILAVFPAAEIFNDQYLGVGADLDQGLTAMLTDGTGNGVVIALFGGATCGL